MGIIEAKNRISSQYVPIFGTKLSSAYDRGSMVDGWCWDHGNAMERGRCAFGVIHGRRIMNGGVSFEFSRILGGALVGAVVAMPGMLCATNTPLIVVGTTATAQGDQSEGINCHFGHQRP